MTENPAWVAYQKLVVATLTMMAVMAVNHPREAYLGLDVAMHWPVASARALEQGTTSQMCVSEAISLCGTF